MPVTRTSFPGRDRGAEKLPVSIHRPGSEAAGNPGAKETNRRASSHPDASGHFKIKPLAAGFVKPKIGKPLTGGSVVSGLQQGCADQSFQYFSTLGAWL